MIVVDPVAEVFFNYLRDVIYNPAKARLDPESLPEGFQDLAKGLLFYVACVNETTGFAQELSKGNLYGKPPSPGNEVASPLKALCASLRHLTWQAKQVAQGDYNQKVDFLGEFAEAFNVMIEQLNVRQAALLDEIESGKRKVLALAQSRSLFEVIAGQVSQWIIVVDKSGIIRYVNHPATEVLFDMVFEERLYEWLTRQAGEEKIVPRTEELDLFGNAREQYFRVEIQELQWDGYDALVFMLTDVSAGRDKLKKQEGMAYHDPLTQTFNRHYGMELFVEWLENRKVFICCFVDIDNLKYVNDKFGHGEGDKYILTVADTLKRLADDVIVCRLGGDEFMLLAEGCTEEAACLRMESMRDELVNTKYVSDVTYRHSISYGIIEVDKDNRLSAGELLRMADEKMYVYKRKHKKPPSALRSDQ